MTSPISRATVFHGSRVAWLKEFDVGREGSGVVSSGSRSSRGGLYFSDSLQAAAYFADFCDREPEAAYLVRAELTLKNPYIAPPGSHPPTEIDKALAANFEIACCDPDDGLQPYDGVLCPECHDGDRVHTVYFAFDGVEIVGYGADLPKVCRAMAPG